MVRRRTIAGRRSARTPAFDGHGDDLSFVSSGCALLDCALGGGYPLGRVVNIVGDKAVGKTLLAIEAAANFARQYPEGRIYYAEVEAAFRRDYAVRLGLPAERVKFVNENGRVRTVENFYADLRQRLSVGSGPCLYILDSLDALSDAAEASRSMDQATYGAEKARKMSELFRRISQRASRRQMLLIIISQVRDNIGATFGRKHRRSGGRALDFYASQVVYLAQKGVKTKTVRGVRRPVAVDVRAKVEKNKVGWPLREADIEIAFGYGVDDVASNARWLDKVGRLRNAIGERSATRFLAYANRLQDGEYRRLRRKLARVVRTEWDRIEQDFVPERRKYAGV